MLKQLSDKYIKYKVLLIFLASFFRTVAAVGRYIFTHIMYVNSYLNM
jgi:hypothetical protein